MAELDKFQATDNLVEKKQQDAQALYDNATGAADNDDWLNEMQSKLDAVPAKKAEQPKLQPTNSAWLEEQQKKLDAAPVKQSGSTVPSSTTDVSGKPKKYKPAVAGITADSVNEMHDYNKGGVDVDSEGRAVQYVEGKEYRVNDAGDVYHFNGNGDFVKLETEAPAQGTTVRVAPNDTQSPPRFGRRDTWLWTQTIKDIDTSSDIYKDGLNAHRYGNLLGADELASIRSNSDRADLLRQHREVESRWPRREESPAYEHDVQLLAAIDNQRVALEYGYPNREAMERDIGNAQYKMYADAFRKGNRYFPYYDEMRSNGIDLEVWNPFNGDLPEAVEQARRRDKAAGHDYGDNYYFHMAANDKDFQERLQGWSLAYGKQKNVEMSAAQNHAAAISDRRMAEFIDKEASRVADSWWGVPYVGWLNSSLGEFTSSVMRAWDDKGVDMAYNIADRAMQKMTAGQAAFTGVASLGFDVAPMAVGSGIAGAAVRGLGEVMELTPAAARVLIGAGGFGIYEGSKAILDATSRGNPIEGAEVTAGFFRGLALGGATAAVSNLIGGAFTKVSDQVGGNMIQRGGRAVNNWLAGSRMGNYTMRALGKGGEFGVFAGSEILSELVQGKSLKDIDYKVIALNNGAMIVSMSLGHHLAGAVTGKTGFERKIGKGQIKRMRDMGYGTLAAEMEAFNNSSFRNRPFAGYSEAAQKELAALRERLVPGGNINWSDYAAAMIPTGTIITQPGVDAATLEKNGEGYVIISKDINGIEIGRVEYSNEKEARSDYEYLKKAVAHNSERANEQSFDMQRSAHIQAEAARSVADTLNTRDGVPPYNADGTPNPDFMGYTAQDMARAFERISKTPADKRSAEDNVLMEMYDREVERLEQTALTSADMRRVVCEQYGMTEEALEEAWSKDADLRTAKERETCAAYNTILSRPYEIHSGRTTGEAVLSDGTVVDVVSRIEIDGEGNAHSQNIYYRDGEGNIRQASADDVVSVAPLLDESAARDKISQDNQDARFEAQMEQMRGEIAAFSDSQIMEESSLLLHSIDSGMDTDGSLTIRLNILLREYARREAEKFAAASDGEKASMLLDERMPDLDEGRKAELVAYYAEHPLELQTAIKYPEIHDAEIRALVDGKGIKESVAWRKEYDRYLADEASFLKDFKKTFKRDATAVPHGFAEEKVEQNAAPQEEQDAVPQEETASIPQQEVAADGETTPETADATSSLGGLLRIFGFEGEDPQSVAWREYWSYIPPRDAIDVLLDVMGIDTLSEERATLRAEWEGDPAELQKRWSSFFGEDGISLSEVSAELKKAGVEVAPGEPPAADVPADAGTTLTPPTPETPDAPIDPNKPQPGEREFPEHRPTIPDTKPEDMSDEAIAAEIAAIRAYDSDERTQEMDRSLIARRNALLAEQQRRAQEAAKTPQQEPQPASAEQQKKIDELLDFMGLEGEERATYREHYESHPEDFDEDYSDYLSQKGGQGEPPKEEGKKDGDDIQQEPGKDDDMEAPMPKDGKGKVEYRKASTRRTRKYLYEDLGLSKEDADSIVDYELEKATKAQQEYEQGTKRPTIRDKGIDGDPEKLKQKLDEYENAAQAAKEDVRYWEEVKRLGEEPPAAEPPAENGGQANSVGKEVTERWASAPKIYGKSDTMRLENNTKLNGRYVLVPSGAASASHDANNNYSQTPGFPVDANGNTANSRDYRGNASYRETTERHAEGYNENAIQDRVVVSKDGVVLSGNGRTMAGELAARHNTDKEYIDYLREHAEDFGFTREQVESMEHPRVLFEVQEDLPYTAETFDMFNKGKEKVESKTETAVRLGKTTPPETISKVLEIIDQFDNIGEFNNNNQAPIDVLKELARAGVITQNEINALLENGKLSPQGKDFIENLLVGNIFAGDPDAVRILSNNPDVRQKVTTALSALTSNARLGNGFSVVDEITTAIKLIANEREGNLERGSTVQAITTSFDFGEDYGSTPTEAFTNQLVITLTEMLNGKRVREFKEFLDSYNNEAEVSAGGETRMFGNLGTKEEIFNFIIDNFKNGRYKKSRDARAGAGQGETERAGDEEAGSGAQGARADEGQEVGGEERADARTTLTRHQEKSQQAEGEDVPLSVPDDGTSGMTRDVRTELERDVDNETLDHIDDVAKSLGLKIRMYDGAETENGYIDGDTIMVNRNSGEKITFIMGHEVTHDMQKKSEGQGSSAYDQYKKAALGHFRESKAFERTGDKSFEDYVKRRVGNYQAAIFNHAIAEGLSVAEARRRAERVTEEYIHDEIAADEAGRMYSDPEHAREMFRRIEDVGTLRRIYEYFKGLWDKVAARLTGKSPEDLTPEERQLLEMRDKFNEMYNEVLEERESSDVDTKLSIREEEDMRKQQESKNFKDWFGDWENDPENASKVVDENGRPKVVLHGTPNKDFYAFELGKAGSGTDAGWLGEGFYFYGNNRDYASQYAGKDGRILEVYLDIKNPYIASYEEMSRLAEANDPEVSRQIREELEAEGYDGVFYNDDLNEEWVAFYPEQIKSATENNGDFSRENPDIRYSVAEDGGTTGDLAARMRERMRQRMERARAAAGGAEPRTESRAESTEQNADGASAQGVARTEAGGAGSGEPPVEPPVPPASPEPEPAPELPATGYERPRTAIELAQEAAMKAVADTKASLEQRNAARRELTSSLRELMKAVRKMKTDVKEDEISKKLYDLEDSFEAGEISENEYKIKKAEYLAQVQPGAAIKGAMDAQSDYDRATVENVVGLCKAMVQSGLIDRSYVSNLTPLFTKLKDATGKQDLTSAVNGIMDVMLKSQERSIRNELNTLLNTKAQKVNQSGVVTQGGLDISGQRTLQELRDNIGSQLTDIDRRISDLEEERDRVPAGHQERVDAIEDKIAGSLLARQYIETVSNNANNVRRAEEGLASLKERYKAGEIGIKDYTEQKHALEGLIRSYRMAHADAMWDYVNTMRGLIAEGKNRAKEWVEQQKEHKNEIRHNAYSDMEGTSKRTQGDPTMGQKVMNMGILRFLSSSLYTLQTMLKSLGNKHALGEGYLYNRFFRGWMEQRDAEITEYRNDMDTLNAKAKELTGRTYFGIYNMIQKLPKMTVEYMDGGEMVPHELDQGQLGYAYMVNKMEDGAAALRGMGITDEKMQEIANFLNPELKKFYDWLQDDFLAGKWEGMNEVHQRMFGADMDRVENYIPLHRDREAGKQEVDVSQNGEPPLQSTVVGSIIQRVHSNLGIDLKHNNAIDVVAKHLLEATHWKHFSEWKRDANTLLSDTTFRNKVKNSTTIYGSGDILWNRLNQVFQIAGGDYKPKGYSAGVDGALVNIAKTVNTAKVSMRVFTAVKQLLSLPAFASECNTATLLKNVAFLLSPIPSKSAAQNSFVWCMENLPQFRERVVSRTSGETRLENGDLGWGYSRRKVLENAARIGLAPNAFIDACTIAAGAKSIYEKRFAQYKKDGYSEEAADKKAKIDAEIAFNESQQSSEKAFVSPIQVDRTAAALGLSTFRNASMGFERKFIDAVRNFRHLTDHKDTVAFMQKQMERDGLTETQAKKAAERLYRRALWRSTLNFLMFGFGAQMAWNAGGKLPYLIFGDDDEQKEKMLKQAAIHAAVGGWIEGLPAGDMLSEGMTNWAMNLLDNGDPFDGASFFEFDPDLLTVTSDIVKVTKAIEGNNPLKGATDFMNLIGQIYTGVNPQTFTDAGVAIYDACDGDVKVGNEALMCVLRIMQCPQSQLDQMYIDELKMSAREARDLSPEEVARRYAYYKAHKDAPYMWWMYNQAKQDEIVKKYEGDFTKKLNKDVKEAGATPEDYRDLMRSSTTTGEHQKNQTKYINALSERGPEALRKAWETEADQRVKEAIMERYLKDTGEQEVKDNSSPYSAMRSEEATEKAHIVGNLLGFDAELQYKLLSSNVTAGNAGHNKTVKAFREIGGNGVKCMYRTRGKNARDLSIEEGGWTWAQKDAAKAAKCKKFYDDHKEELERIYRSNWRSNKIDKLLKDTQDNPANKEKNNQMILEILQAEEKDK